MATAVQVPISTLAVVCDCRRPAIGLCAWPMQKPTQIKVSALDVGDVICFSREPRYRAEILKIDWDGSRELRVAVRFIGRRAGSSVVFRWPVSSHTHILRSAPCNDPVCDLHAREVAEGRVYCSAHWNAWLEIS
jgi:hypothetical protein